MFPSTNTVKGLREWAVEPAGSTDMLQHYNLTQFNSLIREFTDNDKSERTDCEPRLAEFTIRLTMADFIAGYYAFSVNS